MQLSTSSIGGKRVTMTVRHAKVHLKRDLCSWTGLLRQSIMIGMQFIGMLIACILYFVLSLLNLLPSRFVHLRHVYLVTTVRYFGNQS